MQKPASLPRIAPAREGAAWKRELSAAFTRPRDLIAHLGLDPTLLTGALAAAGDFPMLVPRGFAALMASGDPGDPLLRQVLPLGVELAGQPGYVADPVGDRAAVTAPGLLQKYAGRALLVTTGACAVHCRYCFRRAFPYAGASAVHDRATAAIAQIAGDPDITEAILSGGDPLMLDDDVLALLLDRIEEIPHLRRVRLHTRLPIVLPERVTADLCNRLAAMRLPTVVVVHANHPRELATAVVGALARLRATGTTLLNQSVLLGGVNDEAQILCALSEALFAAGVLPYYLHLLDRVSGAAHFAVDETTARGLMRSVRARLPGYLVPRLVREEAGQRSKTPVGG